MEVFIAESAGNAEVLVYAVPKVNLEWTDGGREGKESRYILKAFITLVLVHLELRKSILLFHNHLNISIDTSILS